MGWAATAADAADGASLWRVSAGMNFPRFPRGFCQNKTPKERHKNHFHTKKIILSNYIHNLTEKQKTVVITVITFIANFKIICRVDLWRSLKLLDISRKHVCTLWKTNIEPANLDFKKKSPLPGATFRFHIFRFHRQSQVKRSMSFKKPSLKVTTPP